MTKRREPMILMPSITAALALAFATPAAAQTPPGETLASHCARVGDDDVVRGYAPALRDGTVLAFRSLFPDAKGAPDEAYLESNAQYRCMRGKPFVCFVGANLPCVKMNASRENAGAVAYCRMAADGDHVAAASAGHDAVYSFRCRAGRAEVDRTLYRLDERGFATEIWTEVPGR